jgi:uncharacterized membrane protein YfcA
MTYVLAFLALVVGDFCWAIYTAKIQEDQPVAAGLWAVGIYGISAAVTIGYTQDHWLLIPACVGAFFGTFAGVWWNKRKKEKKQ